MYHEFYPISLPENPENFLAITAITDCTKDIKAMSEMYLIQFINLAKSVVAIMSEKFGFAYSDGNVSGVRLPRGRWTVANVSIGVNNH